MPNVAYEHPEYRNNKASYELIDDCLAGEQRIKSKKTKYLPAPNEDDPDEGTKRYNSYLTRAVFYNVAQRTMAGLVGQVFLRDPVVEVPKVLDPVILDATGSGVPLDQLAQELTGYGVSAGRGGLYIDYPSVEINPETEGSGETNDNTPGATSLAQLESGEVRPTIKVVPPRDCINWRVKRRGAKLILSLVVFREDYISEDDGFETKKKDQWRVLRIDPATDTVVIEVYRNKIGTKADETYMPRDHTGAALTELPFTFVGAVNNDPKVDAMPMYDLCSINIGHYRNSADYEEAVYLLGQPTGWFSGLTEQWVKDVLGGRVPLGSRAIIPLPANASAGLLQVQPNTLAKEAMDQKEAQMLALGAKLVEGSQVQRTATEADIDNISETSILSSVAKNVASGIQFALEWALKFTGGAGDIKYDLNTEFDLVNLTPEQRAALLKEYQSNIITFEEYRAALRRAGVAFLDDAKAKQQLDAKAAEDMANAVAEAGATAEAMNLPKPGVPAAAAA
jgi:hypothetical protein